ALPAALLAPRSLSARAAGGSGLGPEAGALRVLGARGLAASPFHAAAAALAHGGRGRGRRRVARDRPLPARASGAGATGAVRDRRAGAASRRRPRLGDPARPELVGLERGQ